IEGEIDGVGQDGLLRGGPVAQVRGVLDNEFDAPLNRSVVIGIVGIGVYLSQRNVIPLDDSSEVGKRRRVIPKVLLVVDLEAIDIELWLIFFIDGQIKIAIVGNSRIADRLRLSAD